MADTAAGLRAWAKGVYPLEAGVELLIRAFDGRFAYDGMPWVAQVRAEGRVWVDADVLAEQGVGGPYSSGERRVLAVVASMLGSRPVDLSDVLPGLDRVHLSLVLAAVAHAGGSHEQSELVEHPEYGLIPSGRMAGSLYPWPEEEHRG